MQHFHEEQLSAHSKFSQRKCASGNLRLFLRSDGTQWRVALPRLLIWSLLRWSKLRRRPYGCVCKHNLPLNKCSLNAFSLILRVHCLNLHCIADTLAFVSDWSWKHVHHFQASVGGVGQYVFGSLVSPGGVNSGGAPGAPGSEGGVHSGGDSGTARASAGRVQHLVLSPLLVQPTALLKAMLGRLD